MLAATAGMIIAMIARTLTLHDKPHPPGPLF